MKRRGGKINTSTSLAQLDYERVCYLAARDHTSVATWIRRVVVPAIEKELGGVDLAQLACADCGHLPSAHGPQGCRECRCPKFRSEP